MAEKITKNAKLNTLFLIISLSIIFSLVLIAVYAAPEGPVVEVVGNTTKNATAATMVNPKNDSSTPGGFIFTLDLTSEQKNTRWKGYVGNVTGTLTLDDAYDNTIFQWTLTTVTGEVYATRASGNINWSGINCTWIADGRDNKTWDMINRSVSNRTPEHNENDALSHTNADDNITATFDKTNHSSMTIGSVVIGKDECFSLQTWQRDSEQVFEDSDDANFTEIILYDGAFNSSDGNVIYATKIENNKEGYDVEDGVNNNETYDFQMIVPEDGSVGFSGATAYYFYVELA